jgi:uncharacterized protein YecE (DUF72 family)
MSTRRTGVGPQAGEPRIVIGTSGWPRWDTVSSDLVYVRLHGHARTYVSHYRPATLERWAQRIRSWAAEGYRVHVYFDNTAAGAAVGDAERLRALIPELSP